MSAIFSIVIPTYNRASIIGEAIVSAATQDNAGDMIEIVIVDDSTDDTIECARLCASSFAHCRLITHRGETRLGVTGARNKGIDLASGDILVFLDSDDQLTKGSLSYVREFFDDHPEVDVLFGRVSNKSGQPARCRVDFLDRAVTYEELIQEDAVGEFLPIVRRRALQESGLRYPAEAEGSEGVLWRRLPRTGYTVWYTSTVLRLYDDIGSDRNSTPRQRVKRARVFARGHLLELREFGADLRRLNRRAYAKKVLKAVLYNRLAQPPDPAGNEELRQLHPAVFEAASALPGVILRKALEWSVRARQAGLF